MGLTGREGVGPLPTFFWHFGERIVKCIWLWKRGEGRGGGFLDRRGEESARRVWGDVGLNKTGGHVQALQTTCAEFLQACTSNP